MTVSVVIPTLNEAPNAPKLISRLESALAGVDADILFVDDGTDDLPEVVAAMNTRLPIRVIRRDNGEGGLGGAVALGIGHTKGDVVVVMDGDLQHPPELVRPLSQLAHNCDLAVATRYREGGATDGLENGFRRAVSRSTCLLTRAAFPERLKSCSDPMSGFFAVRRDAVDLNRLRPKGFKILLEIVARAPRTLEIQELPFSFADRIAGESHASTAEGLRFIFQLLRLRTVSSKALAFLAVGASGVIPNLAILALLLNRGLDYLPAAVIATQFALLWNFAGSELFVWKDHKARRLGVRLARFMAVSELDLARIPLVFLLLAVTGMGELVASMVSMLVLFGLRFLLADRLVYRSKKVAESEDARVIRLPTAALDPEFDEVDLTFTPTAAEA